mmetsp:Transcript_6844/g.17068  ORF Transcript_6844/g.17068 Transcript_6844/m.17068 type:complete len:256 (+) Transcript_6844:1307-2074(+)
MPCSLISFSCCCSCCRRCSLSSTPPSTAFDDDSAFLAFSASCCSFELVSCCISCMSVLSFTDIAPARDGAVLGSMPTGTDDSTLFFLVRGSSSSSRWESLEPLTRSSFWAAPNLRFRVPIGVTSVPVFSLFTDELSSFEFLSVSLISTSMLLLLDLFLFDSCPLCTWAVETSTSWTLSVFASSIISLAGRLDPATSSPPAPAPAPSDVVDVCEGGLTPLSLSLGIDDDSPFCSIFLSTNDVAESDVLFARRSVRT